MTMKPEKIGSERGYRILRHIADGGMGSVYEAVLLGAVDFQKTVAVKTILEKYAEHSEFVRLFIGEAKLVADLVHENIVQVYDLGLADGNYYIVMEYVDGLNLEVFIRAHLDQGIAAARRSRGIHREPGLPGSRLRPPAHRP